MKTIKGWREKGGIFTDYCQPGDEIHIDLYDHFLRVVFPIRMDYRGFLVGECARHDEEGRGVYDCFTQIKGYRYAGQITLEQFDKGEKLCL